MILEVFRSKKNIFIIGVPIIITVLVIYLTPLKNLSIIEPQIKDIPAQEFNDAFRKNPDGYIFIDVRPVADYNRIHASGSISMPLHTLYNERLNLPKRGKTIVLICSGGFASGVGYMYLEHYGFLNVRRVGGGIEAWHATGLPVETELLKSL